jgi:hypothetical protein
LFGRALSDVPAPNSNATFDTVIPVRFAAVNTGRSKEVGIGQSGSNLSHFAALMDDLRLQQSQALAQAERAAREAVAAGAPARPVRNPGRVLLCEQCDARGVAVQCDSR